MDIERILEKADLVTLAERAGARLKRSGNGWRGACPLHSGDNPTAFVIYADRGRQRWHCYTGCNAGGDAIDFVRRWRNLPAGPAGFVEAVRVLAEVFGVPLTEAGPDADEARQVEERRQEREQRRGLLAAAADYYTRLLWSPAGQAGLEYARKRGWADETIKAMGLGYSDGGLLEFLRQREADLQAARAVGLVYEQQSGELADAIPASYLIYPHHLYDSVVYLSGRAIHTDDGDKKARNLHSSKRLFWAMRDAHAPLLIVEGQACAITAWQWGYNAVALCGTHLDEHDAGDTKSYPVVYQALDNDAADKVRGVADAVGPLTMILPPLPANDLNGWLQAGGSATDLAGLVEKARPWVEMAIEQASSAPAYELEEHVDHLASLAARLPQSTRGKYVREICDQRKLCTRRDFRNLLAAYDDRRASGDGYEVVDGRLTCFGESLCNFDARITHELTQDDGMNPPTVLYTIGGALDSGEKLDPIEVKADEFDGMRWVGRHWGARPTIHVPPSGAYRLRRAVQEVSRDELKRERVYTYTGWAKIEGRRLFLTASGGLGAEGLDKSVRVDLGLDDLSRYALPEPPADLRPAIEASLEFLKLAPYSITVPLWLAMYAAPLSPIKPLNALLWVYGLTQSGKSTLTHTALTHYGPTFIEGYNYHAPQNWSSTFFDLEWSMFVIKDAPLIIDDYAPAHSGAAEARNQSRNAQFVIRAVGNRAGKGRGRQDQSIARKKRPRSLVVCTAENPIIGQSTVGRMIYVPVEFGQIIREGDRSETPLDLAQQKAAAGLYAQAMAGYIVWLAKQWDGLAKELPRKIEHFSRVGRELFPSGQSRLTDYYGLLTATAQLALEYAADSGVLNPIEAEAKTEAFRLELVALLRAQSERVAAESPVVKFFQALGDLLAQKKVYFAPRLDESFPAPYQAELVGWYDEPGEGDRGRVYLLTNVALGHVKRYWEELDERFDTLGDALRRELWQQGYVAERDGAHIEEKPYINRTVGRVRVLVLDGNVLKERGALVLTKEGEEDSGLE